MPSLVESGRDVGVGDGSPETQDGKSGPGVGAHLDGSPTLSEPAQRQIGDDCGQ